MRWFRNCLFPFSYLLSHPLYPRRRNNYSPHQPYWRHRVNSRNCRHHYHHSLKHPTSQPINSPTFSHSVSCYNQKRPIPILPLTSYSNSRPNPCFRTCSFIYTCYRRCIPNNPPSSHTSTNSLILPNFTNHQYTNHTNSSPHSNT